MSITEIKEEAKVLSVKERQELVAYLVHLDQASDTAFLNSITQKIDDKDKFTKWSDLQDEFSEN